MHGYTNKQKWGNKKPLWKDVDKNNLETKKWNKSWIMLLTSVIYSYQLCSFRYMIVATVLGWILADLYFLLTYWLLSSDISLFLVTQMWKGRNWLNQSLEDCGRKVFKRLVCRSCNNYEVFFSICMLERLESCKMWLRRKVLNITWSDKVCKEEVLRHVGEERTMISVIKRRQRV